MGVTDRKRTPANNEDIFLGKGAGLARFWKKAVTGTTTSLVIASPYLTPTLANRIIGCCGANPLLVVTKFSVFDFVSGASSLRVLRLLVERPDTRVVGVRNLHAKLMAGESFATLGSQNLTQSSCGNIEASVSFSTPGHVQRIRQFVENLVESQAAFPITLDEIAWMETQVKLLTKLWRRMRQDLNSSEKAFQEYLDGKTRQQELEKQRRLEEQLEAERQRQAEEAQRQRQRAAQQAAQESERRRAEAESRRRTRIETLRKTVRESLQATGRRRLRLHRDASGTHRLQDTTGDGLLEWQLKNGKKIELTPRDRYLMINTDDGQLRFVRINKHSFSKLSHGLVRSYPIEAKRLTFSLDFSVSRTKPECNLSGNLTDAGGNKFFVYAWLDAFGDFQVVSREGDAGLADRFVRAQTQSPPKPFEDFLRQELMTTFNYGPGSKWDGQTVDDVFGWTDGDAYLQVVEKDSQPFLVLSKRQDL